MRIKLGVLMAGISFFCLTVSVVAHHGFDTEYDANKKLKLTGVVTKVEWLNPHMRVYIDVADANGKVNNWNLELTSPNTVRRQGWGPKDLLPGEKVIFEVYAGKVIETRARWRESPRPKLPRSFCLSRADRNSRVSLSSDYICSPPDRPCRSAG